MIFIRFRLKLGRSLCFSVFISVLFYRESHFFLAYFSAMIHEFAHGLAAYYRGIKPCGLSLGIFGIKLCLPQFNGLKDKLIVYSAGPVSSLCMSFCFLLAGKIFGINSDLCNFFAFANFAICIVNILPVFPLDGGIILKTVLASYFGIIKSAKKCRVVSDIVFVFLVALCMGLAGCGVFNPSVGAIPVFLILNRRKENCTNLSEKKTVLSGNVVSGKRLKYMACDAESELLCLAEYISYDYTLVVATFYNEKFFCDLNQYDIVSGMKKYGALCTVREYVKNDLDKL